jgi:hypothetical protein
VPLGWARPRGVDHAGNLAASRGGLGEGMHRLARGHVDGGGADVKAGVSQHLSVGVGAGLAKIGEQNVLAGADTAGDRLADLPGADDHGDLAHG